MKSYPDTILETPQSLITSKVNSTLFYQPNCDSLGCQNIIQKQF